MMTLASLGQQEWLHTQHAFSLYDVNAAAVGDGQQNAISVRYRNQWTGVDGAPESLHFSYQSPYAGGKIAWGTQVLTESIGAHRNSSLQGSIAYRIKTGKNSKLAFAIEAGIVNLSFDLSELRTKDFDDPSLVPLNNSSWSPVFNSAVFWRTKRTYVGAEFSRLSQSDYVQNTGYTQSVHARFIAGHAFPLRTGLLLKPMALMQFVDGQSQLEIQSALFIQNKLWLGAGYREGFGLLSYAEYQFSSRFRLGYSFDFPTGNPTLPGGSHELFIGIQWADKSGKLPSIRYFN